MLHLIAVCTNCPRQYRVDDKKPGDRFHCLCGTVIRVQAATQGLEADVVRCSSCGAPREKGARSCQACQSDFTIHEKDLYTVCPECTARISNKAKFCHHCGQHIAPEFVTSASSKFSCPNCENQILATREIGDNITFLECQSCAGMWLGQESFAQLLKKNRDDDFAAGLKDVFPKIYVLDDQTDSKPTASTKFYKNCPSCKLAMNRRNFAQQSGVIIDVCKDHGIWFDENELTQLLRWVREGGLSKVQSKLEFDEKLADFKKHSKKTWDKANAKNEDVRSYLRSKPGQNALLDFGESFADVIGDFFDFVIK